MDYLDKLNKEQRDAALHTEGPLLILAGAGSGKTSTMTHRIAYLIKEKKISPQKILAVTFTNKAAGEMRERVEELIGGNINMWILTFHAACLRILRLNASLLGYSNDFTVYDPTDQKTVVRACIKEQNVDEKSFSVQYVLSRISDAKEKAVSPERYGEKYGYDFREKIAGSLYASYEQILKKNNAMDFDDLILRTVQIFERYPEVLTFYQDKFQYLMVDEYQDTNFMQYRFVRLLAEKHQNICVVGDDDQCIYQWRGADIKNILDFEKDFKKAKVVKLEQNYRSHGNILDAAHSVIANNRDRKQKKLWTDKEKGEKIKYFRASDEKDEARYIAGEIDRLKSKSVKYSDFAILYRTNAQSRTFEDGLIARDIPYRVLGGTRYYDRKEVKDIVSYMRLVQNTQDNISLIRVINEPKRGIGERTLEKLSTLATVRNVSVFEVLTDDDIVESLPAKATAGIREMVKAIREFSAEKDNMKVSDIYDGLLIRTGYLKGLEEQKSIEAEGRIENLLEFKSVIYDFEHDNPLLSLIEFLERVALMSDIDNHDADENAVTLMTLHSAKGLEFPVVFMPGMEDGLFPGWRSFDKPDGISEERRLCYVGMTRAKEKLILTSAEQRTLYGRTDYTRESQFIKEINKDLMDAEGIKRTRGGGAGSGAASETRGNSSIFKPFEQLKYIKEAHAAGKISRDSGDIRDGVRVRHAKFGDGLVISIQEKSGSKTATIAFDSVGIKQLALDIAPLKKIES